MSPMLSTVRQALRRLAVTLCLICTLCGTSLAWSQPAVAASSPAQSQSTQTQSPSATEKREATYEAMAETAKDPKGLEKEYEKNLEVYEDSQPDKGVVEEAKELIEKVTGQD